MSGPEIQAICPRQLFDGQQWLQQHALVIDQAHIQAVLPTADLPSDIPVQELDGRLAPGFIDLQVNGGGGVMFNRAPNPEGLSLITAGHRSRGTTSLMPTVISDTAAITRQCVNAVSTAKEQGNASLLGIHIEGPFFDVSRRGTHKAEMIRAMEDEDLLWLTSLQDFPVILTLAPEQTQNGQIRQLAGAGIFVCAGHTDATYEQLQAALVDGLKGFTHLFNAMSQLTGRAPGAVGAALDNSESWIGIIADGHHVHSANIRITQRAKPDGKLLLVSDAMSTVGSTDTFIDIYGERIELQGGRLVNAEGNLAGSAIGMIDAVRHCHLEVKLELEECLRMASLYPATFLGLEQQLGRLAPGYRADIVHFDTDYHVRDTWVAGQHQQHSIL